MAKIELNQLDTDQGMTMEDLPEPMLSASGLALKSASNLAAQQALLLNPTGEGYTEARNSLLDPTQHRKFIENHVAIRDALFEESRAYLPDGLADPEISDEEKVQMVAGAGEALPPPVQTSTLETIAETAIVAPAGPEETDRAAEGRFWLSDVAKEVARHNYDMQVRINELDLEQSTGATIVDFGEVLAPFAEWIHYGRLLGSLEGEEGWNIGMGEIKKSLFEYLEGMPLEERSKAFDGLVEIIKNHENVVLPDGNQMLMVETLQQMFVENNGYAEWERWLDNGISLIESLGVGGIARAGIKAAKGASKVDNADAFVDSVAREARERQVTTEVAPSSTLETLGQFNPSLYTKAVDDAVESTVKDLTAGLTGGASKTETLAYAYLPKLQHSEMPTLTKATPRMPDHGSRSLMDRLNDRAGQSLVVPDKTIENAPKRIAEDIKKVDTTWAKVDDNNLKIGVDVNGTPTYKFKINPRDAGMQTPGMALRAAQHALRDFSIPDDAYKVLAKRGVEWDEMSLTDAEAEMAIRKAGGDIPGLKAPSEFAAQVEWKKVVTGEDITVDDIQESLFNTPGIVGQAVNRISAVLPRFEGQGSLAQALLDPASVVPIDYVKGASVAVDRVFSFKDVLVEQFKPFAKGWNKLTKNEREVLAKHMYEANRLNKPLDDEIEMTLNGFSDAQKDLMRKWKESTDIVYHSDNLDFTRTLSNAGYRIFVDKTNNTKLVGKPASKSKVVDQTIYDPTTDNTLTLQRSEVDALSESGVEFMELDAPVRIGDVDMWYVAVPNNPETGFMRKINLGEPLLSYRSGYYPVRYNSNYFIEEWARNADGSIKTKPDGTQIKRVVATARTQKEVDAFHEAKFSERVAENPELTMDDIKDTFPHRMDRALEASDNMDSLDSGNWEVSAARGQTTQRFRGDRLIDAGADDGNLGAMHLMDPLESISQSIDSLSRRASMRTYLQSAKKRWDLTYGDLFEPVGGMVPKYPHQLKPKPSTSAATAAEARSALNYLDSLEKGYVNLIDRAFKALMVAFAQALGKAGLTGPERAAFWLAKTRGPASASKQAAFKMFISLNPLRQAVIQRGQILMLGAHNPTYALGGLQKDWWEVQKSLRLGGVDAKSPLARELKESGVLEAVDAHTFIRQDMLNMAEHTMGQKARSMAGRPLDFVQKVGFDMAEQDVLITAWLSARDKAIKAGKDVRKDRVKDEILAEARSFTLQMNRAGEMSYSQNTLGMITQFFSFQHKAMVQGFTNKTLSLKERASLVAYSTAMFGLDASIFYAITDLVFGEEPSEIKDKARDGVLHLSLNSAITAATGQDANLFWGDLAPTQYKGVGMGFFAGLTNTTLVDLFANSPAGSLIAGGNPRIADAFKTGYRYFTPNANFETDILRLGIKDVVGASLSLSSGFSNAVKTRMALNYKKKFSGMGKVTDSDISDVEALFTMFGIRTDDEESNRRMVNEAFKGNNQKYKPSDVEKFYGEIKRVVTRRGVNPRQMEIERAALQEVWEAFGSEIPRVREEMLRLIQRDVRRGDHSFYNSLIQTMGFRPEGELMDILDEAPDSKYKTNLLEMLKLREGNLDG